MKYKFEAKTIGDCCDIIKKSIHPEKGQVYTCFSLPAFDNSNTPEILNGEEIKSSKFVLDENTILFNKLNPKFRRVWNIHSLEKYENTICSTEFLPLKAKANIEQDYLYYYVSSPYFTRLMDGIRTGTSNSQQRIDWKQFLREPINVPSLPIQRKVVSLLRNIDKKIELNNAINNNLEQQAQALYENIFCIPSDIDTKHISLSDLMDYAGGSQPPASEFVFSERDGYIRFVQIRDYDTDSHITYIPDSPKNKLCEEHDIMIARYGASLGRICFGINGAYNVALAKVFPKKSFFREFLRCYLSSRTFYEGINNKGGRSAQAGFNQSDINSFEIDFPVDETIVKKFECTVAPMFEQRLQLKKENQHLASLRDTLLPKLMSGELDVSNVEI